MLSFLIQKSSVDKKTIAIVFFCVFILLCPAALVISQNISFSQKQTINIVLISTVTTILIVWSLVLFAKSLNYEQTIAAQNDKLQKEMEKRENAIHELQATHKKLSSTSGYLERIIQESTDLITAVDIEYRYISFNNSFKESMKGYFDVDVKVGAKIDDILVEYPTKLEQAKQLWTRSLNGETFTAEQFFTDISGEINIFELSYSPIKNKNGEIIGASQIARNVTKKNLAAEKIKRERDFAATIFDVNKSMIIVVDRDGRIVRFNKACETVSGYKEKEVKGRIFWNVLIPTGNIAKVKQRHRNFEWEDMQKEYISQWITKDEQIRTISWQISTIEDENGTNGYVVGSGIDITEKRESKIAQKRMLEILENSTDFISISDMRGQIIYLNKAGKKMLGIKHGTNKAPVKNNKCHPKWVNEILKSEAYPTAIKNGTWLGQTALQTLDKEEIPTSQLVMVHLNEKNEPEYFSNVIRDVSFQNKISQELEVAKETANKNSYISSTFLANMSHEIRTPMNGVIGLAELLQRTALDYEQKEYVDSIQRSGDSLLAIINDILDFSKLETGVLKFEEVDFDLHKTIESTFDLFTPNLAKKNVELLLHVQRNVPSALRGDPGRLRQIIINFLGNAIKFTEKGEIVVTVKVIENGSSPTLHFSIKDTGIGISAKALRKLFNPFTQADDSITKRFGGTGLGLSISKQYITKMNGELGASSKENIGSTFWFTAKFESQSHENNRTFFNKEIENSKILIVDSNKTQLTILQSITKSWGMLPDAVNSADKAMKLLSSAAEQGEIFDVILIDAEMTDMSSLTLVNKIKSNPKLRNAKVILMPSQNTNLEVNVTKNFDIESLIMKPIRQTKLFDELTKVLSIKKENLIDSNEIVSIKPKDISSNIQTNHGVSLVNVETTKQQSILIAEDNLVNQKVILNQVSSLGYEVDIVENGKAVLDALECKEYALILMDCQMPIMDGFTATKLIRQSEQNKSKHLPIIAVTAHAVEGDKEKCLSVGMDDYISKPTKQNILAKAIDKFLLKAPNNNSSTNNEIEITQAVEQINTASENKNISSRLEELATTCGNETVLECLHLFVEDTDKLTTSMQKSVANNDFNKTELEAHKLKGSSASMGATILPQLSQKLISLAKDEQVIELKIVLKQIIDEYQCVRSIYLDKQKEYEESKQKLLVVG